MGAGPTPQAVAAAKRKTLQRIAQEYGGRYVRPTTATEGYVIGPGWLLNVELQRASNGEACLSFKASILGNPARPRGINYADVLKAIGVERVKT